MDPELQNGSAFQQSLAHDAQDFQANAVKERVPTKAARRIRFVALGSIYDSFVLT